MWWSALILGLAGSLHCAGMCGPLALVLNSNSRNKTSFLLHRILYNVGRIITYGLLGALAGSVGAAVSLAGWQQALSIFLGVLLLLGTAAFLPFTGIRTFLPARSLQSALLAALSRVMKWRNGTGLLVTGILNGFLPCGLVYTALAAAAVSASATAGMGYMVLFGLGTVPLMLAISLSGSLMAPAWRRNALKIFPYITAAVAVLLILRGLDLGIPFISPEISNGVTHCPLCDGE